MENTRENNLKLYQEHLSDKSAEEVIAWASLEFGDKVRFASSLGLEDQVITDLIAAADPVTEIFTLDTGRLFTESYDLIQKTEERYNLRINICFPDAGEVEEMVDKHGINLFYKSSELRKHCCGIRKIHPLRRGLDGLDAWITGLRRDQSQARDAVQKIAWDDANGLLKINPLCDWSETDVRAYITEHDVPYNKLHDQGYPSIGCACCTRAIKPGEDFRAGRWWWESDQQKECGLHIVDGKLVPQKK